MRESKILGVHVFTGGIATETNSFAPFPTLYRDFEASFLKRGDASSSDCFLGRLIARWRDRAAACGARFSEGLFADAQAGGIVARATYERLRDELVSDAASAGPVDILLLFLHGAMIADGYPDT